MGGGGTPHYRAVFYTEEHNSDLVDALLPFEPLGHRGAA
jgi:hypothetical protein